MGRVFPLASSKVQAQDQAESGRGEDHGVIQLFFYFQLLFLLSILYSLYLQRIRSTLYSNCIPICHLTIANSFISPWLTLPRCMGILPYSV